MATQKGAEKWKTKAWLDVKAPDILGNEVIGSVPAATPEAAVGRVLKVSLAWITHNANHSFLTVGLRINQALNNVATTQIDYLESQFSYLHSLIRRHSDAIYTYDALKSKDGGDVVVKLLITTRSKTPYSKRHAIRKELSLFLNEYLNSHTRDEFVKSLLANELQGEGMKRLSKIAPISKFEIKRIELK